MSMKSPWILASAAVLLGAAGCREREAPEQAQPIAQTQQQSEQALERAEEAQEEALEQRESATGAREEVAEARQELTEAQREAQQQSQEALEAQRQAEQQAQIAQQQAQQAKEQLAERQEQQAQAGTGAQAGALLTVNGRVSAAQEDALLLRSTSGESVRLLIDDDTQVLIDGQQGEITDIPEGAEVRASYQSMGEQEPTALRVEVMSRAMGGSGSGAQQQGPEQKN